MANILFLVKKLSKMSDHVLCAISIMGARDTLQKKKRCINNNLLQREFTTDATGQWSSGDQCSDKLCKLNNI